MVSKKAVKGHFNLMSMADALEQRAEEGRLLAGESRRGVCMKTSIRRFPNGATPAVATRLTPVLYRGGKSVK